MSGLTEKNESLKWYQFKKVTNVFGVDIKFFLPLSIVVFTALMTGSLPADGFVRSIIVLMAVGGMLSWIGSITPLIRSIGGKLMLPMFGAVLLTKTGILPADNEERLLLIICCLLLKLFLPQWMQQKTSGNHYP